MGGAKKLLKKVGSVFDPIIDYAKDPLKPLQKLGEAAEDITGITAQKEGAEMQRQQMKQQKDILKKQEAQTAATEEERKRRISRGRQGRRSLLYSSSDEKGVSTKLGG